MKAEVLASTAALVSAICALITIYFNRSQGKGFVWTKDQKVNLVSDQNGKVHIDIEIPLFNLGKGRIRFIKLVGKKMCLRDKSIERYEMDMDEAYFPENSYIISYRAKIYSDYEDMNESTTPYKIKVGGTPKIDEIDSRKVESEINRKIEELGEFIVMLHCYFKDGSWFGLRTKEAIIGISVVHGMTSYLSKERKKELMKYFSV